MFYVARFLFCGEHKYLYYTIPCGPLVDSPSQLIIGSLCQSILTHWQIITGNTFIRKRWNLILSRSFSAQQNYLQRRFKRIDLILMQPWYWECLHSMQLLFFSLCQVLAYFSTSIMLRIEQSCRKYANTCCWGKRHCRDI